MWFGGFQPFTLSDYPGRVAAIAFAQGCNFRCPFCHNGALLPAAKATESLMSGAEVLAALDARRGRIEGLVVSGGEPTFQADLPDFLRQVRVMGYAIKLDTNGSRPDRLAALFEEKLVDYVAMDVKAPFEKYEQLCGVPLSTALIRESIALIAHAAIPHHFRTTAVPALLDSADLAAIAALLPAGSTHLIQHFHAAKALDPVLASRGQKSP